MTNDYYFLPTTNCLTTTAIAKTNCCDWIRYLAIRS
jgi:hypothetical protein